MAGSPGAVPRLQGVARLLWPFSLPIFAAGYLVRAALPFPELGLTAIGAGFLVLAGGLAMLVILGRQNLESFLVGARGEEAVARALTFLPAPFRVYHGLPARAGSGRSRSPDYDHVVVGPTGVFLIETKTWRGRVTVEQGEVLYNGEVPDRPPLEQVKTAAATLRRELREAVDASVEVQPVLCFAEGQLAHHGSGAAGVVICKPDTLLRFLQEPAEAPLSATKQEQVVYVLDHRERPESGGTAVSL